VTGGSKGIGKGIAERLAGSGAQVSVWDIAPSDISGVIHQAVDVTREDEIRRALDKIIAQTSHIDILVNNAGFAGRSAPVERFDPGEWRRLIEVNLTSVFEVSRQVVPILRRSRSGRIVNIASLAGKEGTPMLSAFSSAKAGVIAFTKCLGKELADTNIRVNCVAPAAIDTDLLQQLAPDVLEAVIAKSPMKRLGTVEELADIVLWLCSDACSFSTGAVFDLSGGRATY
jgi:3-oxoacyl-[acyl-carrier protein] reductase